MIIYTSVSQFSPWGPQSVLVFAPTELPARHSTFFPPSEEAKMWTVWWVLEDRMGKHRYIYYNTFFHIAPFSPSVRPGSQQFETSTFWRFRNPNRFLLFTFQRLMDTEWPRWEQMKKRFLVVSRSVDQRTERPLIPQRSSGWCGAFAYASRWMFFCTSKKPLCIPN